MSLKNNLKELCQLPSPSGYESCAGSFLYRYYQKMADEVCTDVAGNIMARFSCGKPNAQKAMVFAHMDSLGLVVKKLEANGFLRIERLGGIPEKILPGLEVMVRSESGKWIPGVIGNKSHHVTDASEKYKVIPLAELYIDMGVESEEELHALGVEVGCPVVYRPRFQELQGDRFYGTAMDNRGGCAIIMDIAERLHANPCKDWDVYLVATVQEEYNLRGGMVAASRIRPDFAISLDVAITGDTPDLEGKLPVKIGGGPVLGMYNFHGRGTLNGAIPHPGLVKMVHEAAKEKSLPLQRFATCGMLTDASYVQLVDTGIPVIDLEFPCRYTHTAVELCSLRDLDQLALLVETLLRNLKPDTSFRREYL